MLYKNTVTQSNKSRTRPQGLYRIPHLAPENVILWPRGRFAFGGKR